MWSFGYWNRKNAKPQRPRPQSGAALYAWVWKEQFWALVQLNFMVLLCCIPVVTAAPALCAMNRVLYNMFDDRPQMLWQEFWSIFRREWKRALLAALLMAAAAGILIWAGGFFRAAAYSGWWSFAALLGLLLLIIYGAYALSILSYVDLSVGQSLKNAGLMLLVCARQNFLVSLPLLAAAAVLMLLAPLSVPAAVVLIVPLFGYTLAACTHAGVRNFMLTQVQASNQ